MLTPYVVGPPGTECQAYVSDFGPAFSQRVYKLALRYDQRPDYKSITATTPLSEKREINPLAW